MLTTQESINYQFSIIFGYSSSDGLITGDLIGPGKLTRKKINELSVETIRFLREFNALLRDYAGSEVFSIEFELHNFDEPNASTRIYPKSMFLLPGVYKDCECLLVALKPETGYVDVHKSRESLDEICELFYEVEEFTNHPKMTQNSKKKMYDKFAGRFSQKLFGKIIEDKWNKKLIGVNVSLPTEKDMLSDYFQVKSEVEILWHKIPPEIQFLNSHFKKYDTSFEGKAQIDHLKYTISEPSINFIAEKILNLGQELINLANIGTINEFQEELIEYINILIKEELKSVSQTLNSDSLISYINDRLNQISISLRKFVEISEEFLISGESGNLDKLIEKYKLYIQEKAHLDNIYLNKLSALITEVFREQTMKKEKLRVSDLRVSVNYFSELINNSLKIIRKSLPRYLCYKRFKMLTNHLIEELLSLLEKEQKPIKILGKRNLKRLEDFLLDQFETNRYVIDDNLDFDDELIFKEFKRVVLGSLDSFLNDSSLKIQDIISFAQINTKTSSKEIEQYINSFKRFSKEINYLLSYILRHSTINRFLKEESEEGLSDPVLFGNKFHRFLEKRLGGVDLFWKTQILEWIKDYVKIFLRLKESKNWTLKEIYNDFIEYLEEKSINENQIKEFLEFLDYYIAKIPEEQIRRELIDFLKQYEISMEIRSEFPRYFKNKIEEKLKVFNYKKELGPPTSILDNKNYGFYSYIREKQLKYFSTLIPRPVSLILKHEFSNEEKQLFKNDLFHVINFKYWHKNVKFDYSNNFKEVYREWLKDL